MVLQVQLMDLDTYYLVRSIYLDCFEIVKVKISYNAPKVCQTPKTKSIFILDLCHTKIANHLARFVAINSHTHCLLCEDIFASK